MKYVTKPVLVRRKRNVTGSLSFGRQIGFRFTVFNTKSHVIPIKIKTTTAHLIYFWYFFFRFENCISGDLKINLMNDNEAYYHSSYIGNLHICLQVVYFISADLNIKLMNIYQLAVDTIKYTGDVNGYCNFCLIVYNWYHYPERSFPIANEITV